MATSIQKGSEQIEEIYKNTGTEPIDQQVLLDKYNAATAAQFAAQREQNRIEENQFYNQMYNTQKTAMNTIRQSNAAAVASGASRGVQAAQELSALLGLQQESVASATELAQANRQTAAEETAAMLENVLNATTQSQEFASQRAQQAIEAGSVNVEELTSLLNTYQQALANGDKAGAQTTWNTIQNYLGNTTGTSNNTGTGTTTPGTDSTTISTPTPTPVFESGIQADGSLAFSTADLNENNIQNIKNALNQKYPDMGYVYSNDIIDLSDVAQYDKIKQADFDSKTSQGFAGPYIETIMSDAKNGLIPVGSIVEMQYGNGKHKPCIYIGQQKFVPVTNLSGYLLKDVGMDNIYIPKGYKNVTQGNVRYYGEDICIQKA